jgi:hypothetical protein
MQHNHQKQKNYVTLFLLTVLVAILFTVGFIRVNGGSQAKPKKTVFTSLNDVFESSKEPVKKES